MAPGLGGQNYGWPTMEGTHCYRGAVCAQGGLEWPAVEYEHTLGCSITGGYVYRGAGSPALTGAYFYGDYCSGRIWSLHWAPEGYWAQTELLKTNVQISSFGEDEAGEIYVAGMGDGSIYRLAGG